MAQEEHASYLKRLKFDEKLKSTLQASFLSNPRLLILILITIIGAGIYSFINLPRRLNPQINIPIVIVNTVLPGAGPADVESLVTVPIEDQVRPLSGVSKVTSTSRDSVSTITLEFQSGTNPDKAKSDVQSAVDSVSKLPEDAQSPNVLKLDFDNQPIWTFAITSDSDYASLDRFSRTLKERLENLGLIDKVSVNGLEEQEIQVLIKPTAMSTYNINPQALIGAIKTSISSFPAGNVKTEGSTFSLTIDRGVTGVQDLREVRVNLSSQVVKLGDIADISEKSKPEQKLSYIATNNQKAVPAISVDVYKTSSADITKAYAQAKKEAEDVGKEYSNQFKVIDILNTSDQIDEQFNDLVRDFTITIVLVFAVLLLFLGSRQAIVSTISVPLTFLITFTVMLIVGIQLSFLAYFSLLLALGLLVDDTIVVISAMTSYYRSGKFTPFETGLLVWRDFIVAIFTTTLTTIWAFVPLLLSTGIIGEFIKPIPIVVSTTLMASFFIAMFITLPTIVFLLKPSLPRRVGILLKVISFIGIVAIFANLVPKSGLLPLQILAFLVFLLVLNLTRAALYTKLKAYFGKRFQVRVNRDNLDRFLDKGLLNFEHVSNSYQGLIKRIVSDRKSRIRTIAAVMIFSVFSYILVPAGLVKNEFFPKTDEDFVYVSLDMPAGTNVELTKNEALDLSEKLRHTPELKYVSTNIGQTYNPEQGPAGGENNSVLFTLTLLKKKERHMTSSEIAAKLRQDFKDYQKGDLAVIEASGGPPAGADVQIKLIGEDLGTLDKYASSVETYLKSQPGITTTSKSVKTGTGKLTFVPDNDKLASSNITLDTVGFYLRLFASGFTADKIKLSGEGSEEKEINIRLSDTTQFADNISSVQIPTKDGSVPLLSLGRLQLEPNPTLITREDGKRTLSVSAGVSKGTSIPDTNAKLEKFADSQLNLPTGYSWATGGANEENNKSVQSIIAAMGLSFMLIILTMVIQFTSFRKALIVMLVIPLSISGVFIMFALFSIPLSFPALIGLLALFGIVVKNSILLVDKISQNIKTGMEFKEAIAEGSASRLEAITLTSVATIFGLVPITLSDPLWRGLGGAIIAGLTFSGTIMLFFIPVVYYYWFRNNSAK